MTFHTNKIDWYIEQFKRGVSVPGYGDAAWFCMTKQRLGNRTGFGMLINEETGEKLIKTLRRKDPNWLPAAPAVLPHMGAFEYIDQWLVENRMRKDYYERDMITDELAENAGLYPLIKYLRSVRVAIVGHPELKNLDVFEKIHIPIAYPDFHLDHAGQEKVIETVRKLDVDIVLFSAGMSSALMIDKLHGIKASMFDCGSMWDAFVGIGGQREWRKKLYEDEVLLNDWKYKNTHE